MSDELGTLVVSEGRAGRSAPPPGMPSGNALRMGTSPSAAPGVASGLVPDAFWSAVAVSVAAGFSLRAASSPPVIPSPASVRKGTSPFPTSIMRAPARDLRISQLLTWAEGKWGPGALVRWGDAFHAARVDSIPTGFPGLDGALGIGGLALGRITEISGPDSTGRQSLAAELIVQCQKQDGVALYLDMAGRLDPDQMASLGVDPAALLVARPKDLSQGLEMAVRLARGGGVRLIVCDLSGSEGMGSPQVGKGLVPFRNMAHGNPAAGDKPLLYAVETGDRNPSGTSPDATPEAIPSNAARSSLMTHHSSLSLALRRLVAAVDRNAIAFLFLTDAGPQSPRARGSFGRQALRYFASVRLEMERREWVRRGRDVIGCRSLVKVVKNKLAPPMGEAEVELIFHRFPPQMPVLQSRGTGAAPVPVGATSRSRSVPALSRAQ